MVTMVGEPQVGVHSLYAETTLPDMTPVNPAMIYDGASVASIPVPSGQFIITDLYFGIGFVYWTIQVDLGLGAGFVDWVTFGFVLTSPPTTEVKRFKTPITIPGGPGVAIRLKVALAVVPAAPIDVNATVRCRTQG